MNCSENNLISYVHDFMLFFVILLTSEIYEWQLYSIMVPFHNELIDICTFFYYINIAITYRGIVVYIHLGIIRVLC